MKEKIRVFLKRWGASYVVVSLLYALVCLVIKQRLNIDIGYLKVFIGVSISAIFAALSISVFRLKRGNSIVKTVAALLILLPIVFLARRVFGVIVFRYSFVVYVVASVFVLAYGIAVFVQASKAKKETDRLNNLLSQKKNQKS